MFAAGAFVAALDAVGQARRQADTAQKALAAADRPWLKVVGLSDASLHLAPGSAAFSVAVGVKNIGQSPAPATFVKAELAVDASSDGEARHARSLCRRAVQAGAGDASLTRLVFPNDDPVTIAAVALADLQGVLAGRDAEADAAFAADREAVGQAEAERRRRAAKAAPAFASLTLVGCLTYTIPAGEAPDGEAQGQTAFVHHLSRPCGDGSGDPCSFDATRPAVLKGDDLVVGEAAGGTFAR